MTTEPIVPPRTDWSDALPRPAAYVLSGGASLGGIQVGMLRALAEVGLTPDLVVGASVGSLNGAVVAEHDGLEDAPRAIVTDGGRRPPPDGRASDRLEATRTGGLEGEAPRQPCVEPGTSSRSRRDWNRSTWMMVARPRAIASR